MRALLHLADGQYAAALKVLDRAVERQRHEMVLHDARFLVAFAHLKAGRPQKALPGLETALREVREHNTCGLLLTQPRSVVEPLLRLTVELNLERQVAARMLNVPGAPQESTRDGSTALSDREAEVLRLIAPVHSNSANAGQLFISIHAVKRHVANVLAKLNVSRRTQAAALARQLGIAE
jgi:ATP/maltotriose-dependent transcriptional regulator MalT